MLSKTVSRSIFAKLPRSGVIIDELFPHTLRLIKLKKLGSQQLRF